MADCHGSACRPILWRSQRRGDGGCRSSHECMSKEIPKDAKQETTRKRPAPQESNAAPTKHQKGSWQSGYNSKGAKGNNKGRSQNFAQYNSSQKWRQGTWSQQPSYDSQGASDPSYGR
eukprot:s2136_g11.t1